MLELTIKATSPAELIDQVCEMFGYFAHKVTEKAPERPAPVEIPQEEVTQGPVITMEQMEEAIANAPVHEEPKQPSIEEVRAGLKELRDRKGKDAVRELLKAFGAESLMELKPGDYLGALARAKMEV